MATPTHETETPKPCVKRQKLANPVKRWKPTTSEVYDILKKIKLTMEEWERRIEAEDEMRELAKSGADKQTIDKKRDQLQKSQKKTETNAVQLELCERKIISKNDKGDFVAGEYGR